MALNCVEVHSKQIFATKDGRIAIAIKVTVEAWLDFYFMKPQKKKTK